MHLLGTDGSAIPEDVSPALGVVNETYDDRLRRLSGVVLIPEITGDWWTIATTPDLGAYRSVAAQPMDFGIWRAADDSWQLGACIRGTGCGGHGRLLYRWSSESLRSAQWRPKGILFEADPGCGETPGGLQAPFVMRDEDRFVMVYGDWVNICMAISEDGERFSRRLDDNGISALFNEGLNANTRDPMLLKHKGVYYVYYTGVVNDEGAIYCRRSNDLLRWEESTIVCRGGSGGCGPMDAECAFVCSHQRYDAFSLFRWHSDGLTSVYWSNDPLDFGVDTDAKRIAVLPVEAARVIAEGGNHFISSLHDDYTGIRLAKVRWVERKAQ